MDDSNFDAASAREWIEKIEASTVREGDVYPNLRDWLKRAGARTVLDIGCGQGILAEKLAHPGYVGVEPSPHLLAHARAKYPAARFVEGNAYALPFPDGSFDAVCCVMVWLLLKDIGAAAREMRRVLEPGGHFLLITTVVPWESPDDTLFIRPLVDIERALRDAGLSPAPPHHFRDLVQLEGTLPPQPSS